MIEEHLGLAVIVEVANPEWTTIGDRAKAACVTSGGPDELLTIIAAQPPIVVAREEEQDLALCRRGEASHPEGATVINTVAKACRIAGQAPDDLLAVMGTQPPVVVARVIEQHFGFTVGVEVANPGRAADRRRAEAGRIAGQAPNDLLAAVGTQPPVLIPGIEKQHLGLVRRREVAGPYRAAGWRRAKACGVAGQAPNDLLAVVGPHPPVVIPRVEKQHLRLYRRR